MTQKATAPERRREPATVARKMLVESDPHQTRIAVLENDRAVEIFVERKTQRGVVGNIYKGRVTRVLPGMQAAFVDIGLERDAFLYVSDVVEVGAGSLDEDEQISSLGGGQEPDAEPAEPRMRSIDELLKDGQELVVQVTKDALANKGARVTTHITLPSRYLVLLPTVQHDGISRRIEDEAERERLLRVLDSVAVDRAGLIVRTAGEGQDLESFFEDRNYLIDLWGRIRRSAEKVRAPVLVHQDLDLALRVVRDVFNHEYSVLWADGEESYQRIVEFLDHVQPALVGRVKLDREEATLFDRFKVEDEIDAALASKVWLKSGGYLVINQTEALVAIDVNTGRYVGQTSLEQTVLRTNLEAVREIVRQIRLRDLSGIIIIDLIDMDEEDHRLEVFEAFESELRLDRAKSKVLSISEFGLIELTRKRSHANLERSLTRRCPYCQGQGRILTLSTICFKIRREVLRLMRSGAPVRELLLRVHPEVAAALQTEERPILEELQGSLGSNILVQGDAELHHESFSLTDV
ncbi:MAG: Rne/Rng family ribonuclease [Acidobacteriota bacterium]